MQAQAQQGDTLDALCHRHLGTTAGGVVEASLAANPGLSGPVIPTGTTVTLVASNPASAAAPTVNLWD